MSTDRNFLFVSDLHLSEGRDPATGWLSRNEDFFLDDPFARFLVHHVNLSIDPDGAAYYQRPWTLVINGDIFDFLQVVTLPAEGPELEAVKGVSTYDKLSDNEREYGLGTRSREIVWKLQQVTEGHSLFFEALAWFVAHDGYEIVLMKGNHDIEIFWPDVQAEIRRQLRRCYVNWRVQVDTDASRTPLPEHAHMPETLAAEHLETAVQFPDMYYYVPDLLFAEHGCQYDPVNSFTNFKDPRLPHLPDLVELPSGSFFVRYFFNKIEEIHPFADNIKPILKYVNWVVANAPSALVRVLFELLPRYLRALFKMKLKEFQDWRRRRRGEVREPAPNLESAGGRFEADLLQLQAGVRKQMKRSSTMTSYGTLFSVVLNVAAMGLFLFAVRAFVLSQYGMMALFFGAGIAAAFISSLLIRGLDALLSSPFLRNAAVSVSKILAKSGDLGSVTYFIYGHDHNAGLYPIHRENATAPPQWYVNTGAWIPVFSEEERLLREDVQLTFLRILPGKPGFATAVPELLQWDYDADRPRGIRMFAEDEK